MSYPKASSLSTNALFMIPRLSIDKFAGYAFLAVPDIFLRTAGNDPSAIFAPLWPHIDEIICAADHIQIMFNNDDRCSIIDQRCKYLKQGFYVLWVQSDGRLIKNKNLNLSACDPFHLPASNAVLLLQRAMVFPRQV